jgi:hypothetical protein
MTSLDQAKYDTIHRSKKPVKRIAEDTGIKEGTLYVYGLPAEANGRDIPLAKLLPIMKAAGNYAILKSLNNACGFLMVRIPRAAANKLDEARMVSDYQKLCADTVASLVQYLEHPDKKNCEAVISNLRMVMAESAGLEKRMRTHHQLELGF